VLVDRRRRDAARGSRADAQPGANDVVRVRVQARPRRRPLAYSLLALGFFGAVGVGAILVTRGPSGTVVRAADGEAVLVPDPASLPLLRARIVSIAESQIGYKTDPATTYCNKYSAYWSSGADDCGNANLDEEWCADFAAWVWQQAGVPVTYEYINGYLNSSAASFYEWGVGKGTWHPVASGYVPQPGDVAVYGLDPATPVAAHVAIVIGYQSGDRGPTAVNGDGDTNAFSIVEVRTDEYVADVRPDGAPLSGYVSPN
jgi:CHAP domain